MHAHYLLGSISLCQSHRQMRVGWFLGGILALLMLTTFVNNVAALPYLTVEGIPLFVQLFVIFMAIYHAAMLIMLKEIKKTSPSPIWNSLSSANYLGIGLTLVTASLLYELHSASVVAHYILILAAGFDIVTHYLANIVLFFLITPILNKKIEIFSEKYLFYYAFFEIGLYTAANIMYNFKYPPSTHFVVLLFFILFSILIIIHYSSALLYISKGYSELGFVRKPFLIGGIGMISYLLSVSLIVYYIIHYLTTAAQKDLYYYISLYAIFFAFTILYFMHFVIEYPSLLQPRWKVLMPVDIPKIAAAITLAFLATSLFFTVREYPHLALYQNIPLFFVSVFLLPVFLGVIFTFTHLKLLSARTKLKYWKYLAYGQYINVTVTFYALSLVFLSWQTATPGTKLFCAFFGLVSAAFYLFFALDLRTILLDQNIKPVFHRLDITRYLVSLSSWFIILMLGVSTSLDRVFFSSRIELISYPLILFFIAFFLIAFGAYLSVTHKGFEEILGKNIWSELSYIFAFLAFLLIYFMYSSMGAQISRFPYHNLAFIGYFAVLIIEIISTRTLAESYKFAKKGEKDIVELLNQHARSFLRTDYLEDLWKKTVARCVHEWEQTKISFDSARRAFDLTELDEATRMSVAVRMLLLMHELAPEEKIAIHRKSLTETKEEIVKILREKILQLPEELRAEFDEDLYYPLLLEKSINDLLTHLSTFIPASEHRVIFEGLRKRDELFACVDFETAKIHVREGTRFGRDKFLEMFKLYLEAVGDKFPFKRCLLRGLVKEEIRTDAHAPIAASEVFDIISTGIKELNLVMAGGLVKGSITLLITEETKAKQKILHALITRNLPEGMSIVYATSKRPYQQIQGELLMALDSLDRVTMLDLYAPLYEEKGVSELVEYDHRILVPLSKILFQRSFVKVIKSQPRNQPWLVIIDVYDDFAKYYQPEELYELLQTQVEGLKRWNCTAVIVFDPHSHMLKKVGADEVKKNFENILVLAGAEKETVVQIEKLFHGTPGKRVVHLGW